MVRRALIVLIVLLTLLGTAAPAHTAAEWCDTDPLLIIRTPDGQLVPVFLLVGALGAQHLPAALVASILAVGEPVEVMGTLPAIEATVTVTVPDDLFGRGFPTRAIVSSGPLGSGTAYAATEGTSGAPMTLRFALPIP
jgi:hypothetical protein